MTKKINILLMKGYLSRNLKIKYSFTYDDDIDSKYKTIFESQKGDTFISPYYSISITEGFQCPSVYIMNKQYHSFVKLLDKSINLIYDNFYDLFPNINQMEFEIDSSVMERFITEKAMSVSGITIVPCVWIDEQQLSYPGIQITTSNNDLIKLPFEDAIAMNQMFNTMDINSLTIKSLQMIMNHIK